MKGRKIPVFGCTVSAIALSMFASLSTMAASDTEIENSKWTYRAVADVTTQVNIRANASSESTIVGYLPKAASADVIERGEEWSHVISGGVEGYIKNEYLAYGQDAKKLASVYGQPGVEVSWDDVNMFSKPDACSSIVEQAKGGSEYEILSNDGLWYSVQTSGGKQAYVPAEDVAETIILERAIPVVTEGSGQAAAGDSTYTDSSNTESYSQNTEPSYSEPDYSEPAADDSNTYDQPAYDSAADTDTEDYGTDNSTESSAAEQPAAPAEETPAAPVTENPPSEETVTSASSSDVSLLAALIYCEAGNQPRDGKVAVGAVVMNRIASSSYPSTISDVIYQSGQFAPAITGWLGQVLSNGAPSNCYEAAQAALNGENPVPGALYFNTSAGKGTKIGDHWFY